MKTLDKSKKTLENIKSEIDNLIFDDFEWIDGEMWKITDVIYSYYSEENFNLNETLFCKIGGVDLKEIKEASEKKRREIILKSSETLTKKIKRKLDLIKKYLDILNNFKTEDKTEKVEIELTINALLERKDLLNYCLNGLPYELEKAGIKTQFNEKEIDEKQKQIDKKNFGGEIKENPKEVAKCYENTFEIFEENKEKLTQKEQIRFLYFLEKIKPFLPKEYIYKKKEKPKSLLKKYKNFKVKDKNYIPGFNFFIDSLESLDKVAKQDKNIGSVCDGPNSISFPVNEKFVMILLERVLKLNYHEIETHSITNHNHTEIFGKLKLAKFIEKDEGLAKFMEYLLEYGKELFKKDEKTGKIIINEEKIPVIDSFPDILMGEILDNNELLEFLELKEKLKPGKISPKDTFLRLKRSNKNGVQHKDCSYMRGLFRLVKEINKYILTDGKQGIKFEDLFLGKFGFDEANKFKKVKEKKEKEKDLNIIMPLLSSDLILFSLEQKEKGKDITEELFLEYLQEKYPIMDFSKRKIKEVSYKTKRNIFGVLNILEHSINGNKSEENIKFFEKNINKLGEKRKDISKEFLEEDI